MPIKDSSAFATLSNRHSSFIWFSFKSVNTTAIALVSHFRHYFTVYPQHLKLSVFFLLFLDCFFRFNNMCLRDTLIRLSIWDGKFPGMNMHLNNPICYGELVILNWASKLFSNTCNYLNFVGCRQRGWVWTFSNFTRDTIPLLCSSLTFWCCIKRLHSAKGNQKFNLFSYSVPHL